MSLPTSLCSRQGANGEPGRIQRFKLQLFKFWPSQDMKQAWKAYIEQEGSLSSDNLNALYLCLKILDSVGQQFSIRQAEKMDRKNKQAIMQAVQPVHPSAASHNMASGPTAKDTSHMSNAAWSSSRTQRAAVRQTIKYFESSEDEDDEDEDDDEQ